MKIFKEKTLPLFFGFIILVPLFAFTLMRWYDDHIAAVPYYHTGISTEAKDLPHFSVPDLIFLNQDSTLLKEDFVKGKIWAVNYFFTSCPTSCPKLMAGMLRIQQAFAHDKQVHLLSLTVDPFHDTPAKLKRYAQHKKIDLNQWQLGTGSKAALYRFARNGLFLTATDGGTNNFFHSSKIVLIDRQNHIRGYYEGTDEDEISRLIKDLGRLKTTFQSN